MIHRVAELDDPRLEPYRHVGDPAWLRARGLFVAEGRHVVERLLALERYRVTSVLLNEAACRALDTRVSEAAADVYVCDAALLNAVTGFNFHRGCLALVCRPDPLPLDVLARAPRILALEGVGNPDNVGGLFRVAAAFGAGGVLLDPATGDPFYRKAVRTSMGAVLRVPFARVDRWGHALTQLRDGGHCLVALTPAAGAELLDRAADSLKQHPHVVLLAGAEGSGLSPETLAQADVRVRVPIDQSVDSLNVVVAAAIALHALRPPGMEAGAGTFR